MGSHVLDSPSKATAHHVISLTSENRSNQVLQLLRWVLFIGIAKGDSCSTIRHTDGQSVAHSGTETATRGERLHRRTGRLGHLSGPVSRSVVDYEHLNTAPADF